MKSIIYARRQKKVNKHIADKLNVLVETLRKSYKLFNEVAHRCSNRKTQVIVYGLATETLQYYQELVSQVQVLERKPAEDDNKNGSLEWNVITLNIFKKEDNTHEIIADCSFIENAIIRGYRELLNDHVIMPDQRKLLQHQLNGFLYAFVKLKVLKNFSFNAAVEAGLLF